jgi:hypothetical protein
MKETHKVKYSDPFKIGFPDNWEIYKNDTKSLAERQAEAIHVDFELDDVEFEIKYINNLFGPIVLSFKDDEPAGLLAEIKTFNTEQERLKWLKENRPLVYAIVNGKNLMRNAHTFEITDPESTKTVYRVRYFSHAGKLSWFKYKLQFLIGKYNFKYIRPFLYRYLVMN